MPIRLPVVVTIALMLIGTVGVDKAAAGELHVLGRVKSQKLDILAEGGDAWCKQHLALHMVLQPDSPDIADQARLPDIMKRLAKPISTDCRTAQDATLIVETGGRTLGKYQATPANAWAFSAVPPPAQAVAVAKSVAPTFTAGLSATQTAAQSVTQPETASSAAVTPATGSLTAASTSIESGGGDPSKQGALLPSTHEPSLPTDSNLVQWGTFGFAVGAHTALTPEQLSSDPKAVFISFMHAAWRGDLEGMKDLCTGCTDQALIIAKSGPQILTLTVKLPLRWQEQSANLFNEERNAGIRAFNNAPGLERLMGPIAGPFDPKKAALALQDVEKRISSGFAPSSVKVSGDTAELQFPPDSCCGDPKSFNYLIRRLKKVDGHWKVFFDAASLDRAKELSANAEMVDLLEKKADEAFLTYSRVISDIKNGKYHSEQEVLAALNSALPAMQ